MNFSTSDISLKTQALIDLQAASEIHETYPSLKNAEHLLAVMANNVIVGNVVGVRPSADHIKRFGAPKISLESTFEKTYEAYGCDDHWAAKTARSLGDRFQRKNANLALYWYHRCDKANLKAGHPGYHEDIGTLEDEYLAHLKEPKDRNLSLSEELSFVKSCLGNPKVRDDLPVRAFDILCQNPYFGSVCVDRHAESLVNAVTPGTPKALLLMEYISDGLLDDATKTPSESCYRIRKLKDCLLPSFVQGSNALHNKPALSVDQTKELLASIGENYPSLVSDLQKNLLRGLQDMSCCGPITPEQKDLWESVGLTVKPLSQKPLSKKFGRGKKVENLNTIYIEIAEEVANDEVAQS